MIEAPDAEGEFYGDERLNALLQKDAALGGEEICTRLVDELAAYGGRTLFEDDVCVVAIESTGATCVIQVGVLRHLEAERVEVDALHPPAPSRRGSVCRVPRDTF